MKKRKIKKSQDKNNIIIDNFNLAWEYMKKTKIYFLAAVLLILFSSFIGYFGIIGFFSIPLQNNINNYVTQSVAEIIKQTQSMSPLELTSFIMSNNIKTAFFGMLSGFFLAISPLIVVIFNGYVLGFVAEKAVTSPLNPSGIFILWRLFPHGIFEIPAILISIGLGIKLGLYPIYLKQKGKGFLSMLIAFFIFFLLSSIIIVILALFISPQILSSHGLSGNSIASSKILDNPIVFVVFYLSIGLSFLISLFAGFRILSGKDRKTLKDMFKDSFRVFIFIIIPLLIVAGLIEGLLIFLVG